VVLIKQVMRPKQPLAIIALLQKGMLRALLFPLQI